MQTRGRLYLFGVCWTLLITAATTLAAPSASAACGGYVTTFQAFSSLVDQQDAQLRMTLAVGPENVQTSTATVRAGETFAPRYVVIATVCDSPLPDPKRRAASHSVIDDGPYQWAIFATVDAAATEYAARAESKARGIASLGDGSIIVYWSR